MNSYYVDPGYDIQQGEKKAIRKTVNLIACAFLAMSFIMVLWSYPAIFLAKRIGLYEVLVQTANDPALLNVLQVTISALAFLVPYALFGKILKVNFGEALNLKVETNFKQTVGLLLLGAGFCAFANYASSVAGAIFESFGFTYTANIHHPNPTDPFGIVLSILATAVTPAIVEEFALRGVVLHALKRFGNGFAVLISATLFGLLHGNFEQIPFAFLVGLYLGFLTIKTKSIVPAVILHFYNNFSSVIISLVDDKFSQNIMQFAYMFYLLIMICLSVVGLFVLRKEDNNFFATGDEKTVLPVKTKVLTALFSPVMLVVYLIVVWEIFFIYV